MNESDIHSLYGALFAFYGLFERFGDFLDYTLLIGYHEILTIK